MRSGMRTSGRSGPRRRRGDVRGDGREVVRLPGRQHVVMFGPRAGACLGTVRVGGASTLQRPPATERRLRSSVTQGRCAACLGHGSGQTGLTLGLRWCSDQIADVCGCERQVAQASRCHPKGKRSPGARSFLVPSGRWRRRYRTQVGRTACLRHEAQGPRRQRVVSTRVRRSLEGARRRACLRCREPECYPQRAGTRRREAGCDQS